MGKRATGFGFCAIAAFLFVARYISAAIYGSNIASGGADFGIFLDAVGGGLLVFSIISLLVGIGYLVGSAIDSTKN